MEKIELIEKKKPSCKYPEFGNHEPLDFTGIKDRINILKPDESQDKIETAVKKVAVNVANIPVDKQEPESQATSGKLNFELSPKEVEEKEQSSTQLDLLKDEYTLLQLFNLNITEIPFLVEKLIPNDSIVVLAGPSETGKSTFYTQLSLAIAKREETFLGFKINGVYKRILIISTEDGPITFAFRINKQLGVKRLDAEVGNNMVVIFNYSNLEDRIRSILKETPVDLIIIDAFGDVFYGDINSSNAVRTFLSKFRNICLEFHCSILFVHHVSKGKKKQAEKDQLLGSVGIEGKMRNVMMLSIINDQHQFNIVKSNCVPKKDRTKPTYLNFDEETLTFSIAAEPAKPVVNTIDNKDNSNAYGLYHNKKNKPGRKKDQKLYAEAINMYNDGVPQVEIAKKVGRDKSTVCKWIKAYKENKGYDLGKLIDEGEVD